MANGNIHKTVNSTPFKSTEIGKDGSLTVRLSAPEAHEVFLTGKLFSNEAYLVDLKTYLSSLPKNGIGKPPLPPHYKMTKDNAGVWSYTIKKLTPDWYSYSFLIDGKSSVDPLNKPKYPEISESYVMVSGSETAFMEPSLGPKGKVSAFEYYSKLKNTTRRAFVYTPPEYNAKKEYPLLVLQHGLTGTDSDWIVQGRAKYILDNLINSGKAVAMIAVFPDGNVDYNLVDIANYTDDDLAIAATPESKYPEEIAANLLPALAKTYRFSDDINMQAQAGLSMGGQNTLSTFFFGEKRFGYYGVFSGALWPRHIDTIKDKYADYLAKSVLNEKKALWIACGGSDPAYNFSLATLEFLKQYKIEYEYRQNNFTWGHNWHSWHNHLYEFAQKLFKL